MLIGNKKVSQLIPMSPSEVAVDDLFLIIDTSQRESKNILASDFARWLNASGSVYAVHAALADTASYILGTSVFGPVASAAFAAFVASASWADNSYHTTYADSASISQTASFALNAEGLSNTSSYLKYSGFPNGTASFALKVDSANTANTAAFLLYFGGYNGTISHAITADSTTFCDTAATASYFDATIGTVASASEAGHAILADSSSQAITASYALYAKSFAVHSMYNYGMIESNQNSETGSILENLIVNPTSGVPEGTLIQAVGTAILGWTASVPGNQYFNLFLFNRFTSKTNLIDAGLNISFNTTPLLNTWGSEATGTLIIPFSLTDQLNLHGEYMLQLIPASPNLTLDVSRPVRYIISSYSDVVYSQTDVPMIFDVQPSESVIITFSSSVNSPLGGGGPFTDYLPGLLATGSQHITDMDISNQGISSVKFTWQCTSMSYFNCESNPLITDLNYSFPIILETLICDNCNISEFADLDNIVSASYIDVSNNQLMYLPPLPGMVTYLDFSSNHLMSLPDVLPISLSVLMGGFNNMTGTLPTFPDHLISASLNNVPFDAMTNLPISLSYLDVSYTSMSIFPSVLPPSMSYLNISSASFGISDITNISGELTSSGVLSGSFIMVGYGPPSDPTLINNILSLISNDWTVLYDS